MFMVDVLYLMCIDLFSVSSRRLSFEDDSFSRFNVDMVRQYLRDDEIRERHQVRYIFTCIYIKRLIISFIVINSFQF